MTPTDRRKRVTDVFQLAVQMPKEERRQFVQRECGGDATLMREVESLLADFQTSYDNPRDRRSDRAPAPPQADPALPVQRIGKYQVTKEIGSGGFGRVYSAIDPNFNRVVAIKVMSAPGDTELVKRFRVEATTVANLHHPNIVNVHDFGDQDGAPYLVMEYLDGTNLQDLIHLNSLSLLEKIQIMSEVANGLQCAHEAGITHRDVKPANIMRLASGAVKIMDFGIARIATENKGLTQTGFIIGTLFYMSPEQFNGGAADPRCDIFAFGVTFYELLTGKNPFAAPSTGETINRVMNVEPPSIDSLLPGCPEGLDRIVKMTIAKNREMRYSSLSDVALDLKPIVMELQRGQAGQFYSQANQLFSGGQLDAAQAAVRKVLEFDPVHPAARQLRTQIEQALQRRDAATRAGTLLEKAEKELRDRRMQDAAATLGIIRQLGPSDPGIRTRLEKAEGLIEQAKRAERLLVTAQEDLRNLNLTEAFRAVSEVLGADPANTKGKALLQEVQAGMAQRETKRKLQEDVARADDLLLIGETDQAVTLIAEIERRFPNSSEAWALRSRAETQLAEEKRKRRLAEGITECKTLLRNGQFEAALAKIEALLADFPTNVELKALHRHAAERLAAERRAGHVAQLKRDAAALIERRQYDQAIRALESGVATLGDDGELTRLLQGAIAGKAAEERNRAVTQVVEEANQLRRQGKLEDAQKGVERAIQVWGDGAPLANLLREIGAERQDRDRRQAINDALRKAGILVEQKKLDAAVDVLRQSNRQNGEDAEISKLLQRVESQLQSRDRSARIGAIIEEMRKLAASRRWQEAFDRAEDELRNFPNEPALIAEREAVRGPMEKERRERAIAETLAKVQPMLAGGRVDEAQTVLLEAKDLQEESGLVDIRRKIEELVAKKERETNIEKACLEAIALRGQDRFDEAIRLLDACDVRYPGSPGVAAALADAKKDRDAFRRKKEISTGLTRASELVQKGDFASGRYLLEDLIKSYPDSHELTEAASGLRSREDDAEHQNEIAQTTASIEQAMLRGEWAQAVSRASSAIEKFPREDAFARLKRKAEESKDKAEIDEIEASAVAAKRKGDLAGAAAIVAAGRKRWDKEKRLRKLGDEIEDARAEEGVAAAKALAGAGNYPEAERKLGEVLARRPKFSSALDLLQKIADLKDAHAQDEQLRAGVHTLPAVKPRSQKNNLGMFIGIAVAVGLVAGIGIFLILSPHVKQPPPKVETATAVTPPSPTGSVTPTPVAVNPQPTTTATDTKPAKPVTKEPTPPKVKPDSTKPAGNIQPSTQPVTQPPPPPPPKIEPACTMTPFVLADYTAGHTGDLVWTGSATSTEIEIHGRQPSVGRASGDGLPHGVPVRFTGLPEGVHVSSAPSPANCWLAPLVVSSSGPMPSRVTIHWEVFQP